MRAVGEEFNILEEIATLKVKAEEEGRVLDHILLTKEEACQLYHVLEPNSETAINLARILDGYCDYKDTPNLSFFGVNLRVEGY